MTLSLSGGNLSIQKNGGGRVVIEHYQKGLLGLSVAGEGSGGGGEGGGEGGGGGTVNPNRAPELLLANESQTIKRDAAWDYVLGTVSDPDGDAVTCQAALLMDDGSTTALPAWSGVRGRACEARWC